MARGEEERTYLGEGEDGSTAMAGDGAVDEHVAGLLLREGHNEVDEVVKCGLVRGDGMKRGARDLERWKR